MDDLALFPDLLATPDRFVWHAATRTAILADLHLGALGGMRGAGGSRMEEAWSRLVSRGPKEVILAGDVMDHPEVDGAALATCRKMLELLPSGCRVTLTPGNHDPEDIGARLGVKAVEAVRRGNYVISHGHVLPALLAEAPGARWIVGHQHPAVTLRTRVQSAKMACYVVCAGDTRQPGFILLPAFSREAGGPLGSNLLGRGNWLLPLKWPTSQKMHIYGVVEPVGGTSCVLDFDRLSGLDELST